MQKIRMYIGANNHPGTSYQLKRTIYYCAFHADYASQSVH